MKNTFLTLSLMIFGVLSFGQEMAKKSLLELEQNIFEKKFSKKWEKLKKSDWEKSCQEANGIEQLNGLFNEYSDLLAQSTSFSMGNSSASNEIEFLEYLMQVEGALTPDLTSKWSETDRKDWKEGMSSFILDQKEKKKKEDQMARFQKMSAIVKSFDTKFPIVWEDSKKNAFSNSSDTKFNGATSTAITEDSYQVKSFEILYDLDGDDQMAEKLQKELIDIILSKVGEGYQQGNEMDSEFNASIKKVLQFEGAKFAETAKRPTVTIGVLKETQAVKLVITEPVFGH